MNFTGLLFIKQFPCFCTQTVDRIALKLCGWTHYGTPHAWLIFGHQWSSFPAFADNSSNCLRLAALWIPSLIKPPAWDVQCIHWCIVTYSWLAYSWVATHSQNTCFWLSGMIKGLSPVTRNLYCQSARGNRSGAVRYFPEAVRPRGNTAAPDRFPRADWQHKFLVTGLNPDYNMVTVRVKHRKVPNRGFQHHGRHFVLRRFWRFPLWFTPPPTLKI